MEKMHFREASKHPDGMNRSGTAPASKCSYTLRNPQKRARALYNFNRGLKVFVEHLTL